MQLGKVQLQHRFADVSHQAFIGQALTQSFGQMLRGQAELFAAGGLQWGVQAGTGALHKALHVGTAAQGNLLLLPLGQHLVGPDAALGELGAVELGFFQGVGPLGLQWGEHCFSIGKHVRGVLRGVALHQRGFDQRLIDAQLVFWHGHQHAQFLLDGLAFAQNDVEHKAIDRVVLAIQHGATHLRGTLAETIDPTLALLMAGGVPSQIVVHHCREQVLQVDSLRKAIGGDKDAAPAGLCAPFHVFNFAATLLGAELAGHHIHQHFGKVLLQLGTDVMGGGHVAAKNHRGEAVFHQARHVRDEGGQLGVT